MSLGQSNANQDLTLAQVWYAGTSKLREGYAVAYDLDATNAPLAPTAGDLSPTTRKNLRGHRVIDPVTAVLGGFAGLVEASSDGAQGPCFITIVKPRKGDICTGWANISCTAGSTILQMTNSGGLSLTTATDATFNPDAVAVAFQTIDLSGTAGQLLIRFL